MQPTTAPAVSSPAQQNILYQNHESFESSSESYNEETGTTTFTQISYKSSTIVTLGENAPIAVDLYDQQGTLSSNESIAEDIEPPEVQTISSTNELAVDSVNEVASVNDVETDGMLAGAANVLSFIENRLATATSEGATKEELMSLLEEGVRGFQEGFSEAYELIKTSSEYNQAAVDEVKLMFRQVFDGFEELSKAIEEGGITQPIFSNVAVEAPIPNVTSADSTPPVAANNPASSTISTGSSINYLKSNQAAESLQPFNVLGNSVQAELTSFIETISEPIATAEEGETEFGRKDTFSFSLTTLDGDVIQIDAKNIGVMVEQLTEIATEDGEESANAIGVKEKSEFSFEVTGELDDDEVAAIQDLLDQVMSLADEFYNGDIDKAYEEAMSIGYDQSEITGFSLSLRQTVQYSGAAAYQDISPEAPLNGSEIEAIAPISDFAQQLLESIKNENNYSVFDYSALLKSISEQLDNQIEVPAVSFSDVAQEVIETAS